MLPSFDYDIVQIFHKEMHDNGINLFLDKKVVKCHDNEIVLEGGTAILSDIIVMAVGTKPNTQLAEMADIELSEDGHIRVNANWQTLTDDNIYAVGEVAQVNNALTKKPFDLQVTEQAQKQARQAANHIYGILSQSKGYIGASCIKVFIIIVVFSFPE